MELGFKANDEQVVIRTFPVLKGQEVKSEAGIILGQEKHGEVPTVGKIVSVGDGCPEATKSLIGKTVALPLGQAAGVMVNVPDPDVVFGRKTDKDPTRRVMVACHYKAIRVVYDEDIEQRAQRTSTNATSTLSSLKGRL